MNKKTLIALALAISFSFGFAFNSLTRKTSSDNSTIKRVTGIGGVFFKCKDPRKVNKWYNEHLGLNTNQYGAVFEWRQAIDSTKKGFSSWSPFKETTKYFEPSTKEFMINYRVDNLSLLLDELRKEGVTIVDTVQAVEYGKFVHIMDIEGNKIELWEPNDLEYEKIGIQMKSKTTK